jgi:hypothetical protein
MAPSSYCVTLFAKAVKFAVASVVFGTKYATLVLCMTGLTNWCLRGAEILANVQELIEEL